MNETNNLIEDYPSKEVKVGKLNTIEDVRNELARLYRAARKASGPAPDAFVASKLAYLLHHISKSIEGADLERRIIELEKVVKSGS